MFVRDDETAALLREATALLDSGAGDDAIERLLLARDRMMTSEVIYPVQTWCKLPLYLSRLARFPEAMEAFDWLIEDLPRRAEKESFMDDQSVSFGKGTSKKSVYSSIVRTGKEVVNRNRKVVLRRMNKAANIARKKGKPS
jgi:hypothetical protein